MFKKKYFIFVVFATFILISFGLSSASIIKKEANANFPKTANKQIYLGQASIYGDGIEENTTINLSAENDLSIGVDSQTEIVDFYITYTMTCNGTTDNGAITLLIQINGEQKGTNQTITFDKKEGILKVENIEVKRRDVLSFQIIGDYTNILPPFDVLDTSIGGGIISKGFVFQNLFRLGDLRYFYSQIIVPLFDIW